MLLRPRNRTLKSSVLRVLVPRVLVFAALSGALLLGHEMATVLSPRPLHDAVLSAPIVPTWTVPTWAAADAAVHPECTPAQDWPRGTPAPYLMVHDFRANADRKMAFGLAWRRTHNATEVDDVWVLGVCSR
jgi:hypothetical protein